jgi:hypothetical protein
VAEDTSIIKYLSAVTAAALSEGLFSYVAPWTSVARTKGAFIALLAVNASCWNHAADVDVVVDSEIHISQC